MPDRTDRRRPTCVRPCTAFAAFVLDADGVLDPQGPADPGSRRGARGASTTRGIPFRVVTNFSLAHRATLARRFARGRRPRRSIPSGSSPRARPRPPTPPTTYPGRPLVRPRGPGRATRVRRAAPARARRGGGGAAPARSRRSSSATPATSCRTRNLDDRVPADPRRRRVPRACTGTRGGCTPKGVTLDAGRVRRRPRVRDRRRARGRSASRRRSCSARRSPALRRDLRSRGVPRPARSRWSATTPDADVRGAQRVGLRGVLVLTGKARARRDVAAPGRRARSAAAGRDRCRRWPRSSPR